MEDLNFIRALLTIFTGAIMILCATYFSRNFDELSRRYFFGLWLVLAIWGIIAFFFDSIYKP